jgi:hypothetical protein
VACHPTRAYFLNRAAYDQLSADQQRLNQLRMDAAYGERRMVPERAAKPEPPSEKFSPWGPGVMTPETGIIGTRRDKLADS